ncbi:MAG: tRNA lysidine(34) synthetase TilS [Anaerolineae bacterium]|nr:tRNA lysidine(34) synthetase TilS [Anaerolineae bacterium]
MLIDQVRTFCKTHRLFEPGTVVVAVSGGADSLALLHSLMALRDDFGLTLHIATFDHRLRGSAGAADVQFVCHLAREWGIPVTAGSADVAALAQRESLGIEAAARQARYTFLAQVAKQVGALVIATGHNQNDQAETVLMHVLRGSGLAGLRGMLPKTPLSAIIPNLPSSYIVVRPLLDVPRAAIDAHLAELGIEPRTDQTNTDTTYTRNRLRYEVLPLLEQINPQVRAALARTGSMARDDYAALESYQPSLTQRGKRLSIDRAVFLGLPISQQRLLIRSAAQRLSPDISLDCDRTQAAVNLITEHKHGASLQLDRHLWLRVISDTITIYDDRDYPANCPQMTPGTSLTITGEGSYALPGVQWVIIVERIDPNLPHPPPSSPQAERGGRDLPVPPLYEIERGAWGEANPSVTLTLPNDSLIELRTRRAGDRFRPRGLRGHTQKLSDTLINMKVPTEWRDRIPLLVIDSDIAWFIAPLIDDVRPRVAEELRAQPTAQKSLWRFTFHSIL